MSDLIRLTQANFEAEVLKSEVPVLVDYWAPGCGHCRTLGPVIERIAAERAGSRKVGKVNVDDEPHLASLAGVQGIPAVVVYRDGRPAARSVGGVPKHVLEDARSGAGPAEAGGGVEPSVRPPEMTLTRQESTGPEGSSFAVRALRRRAGRSRRLLGLVPLGAAVALGACGGTAASKSSAPATAAPLGSTASASLTTPAKRKASASPARRAQTARGRKAGIQISVRASQYGRILRDGADRTIYLFTHDRGTPSTCYGACAAAWPPVVTKGTPTAGSGLNALLLGATRRRDGTLQVTYAGHPLYYYVADPKGQILCQNVEEYGGKWLVVSPYGTPVR
jgi:thioredoxin